MTKLNFLDNGTLYIETTIKSLYVSTNQTLYIRAFTEDHEQIEITYEVPGLTPDDIGICYRALKEADMWHSDKDHHYLTEEIVARRIGNLLNH